ncbi:MAG: hypothetical protein J6J33_00975 [Clostridia bacterium]|nr:hypothetical protein [Clostridia bacterium]
MLSNHINILGTDEEEKIIYAEITRGDIKKEVLPEAVAFMNESYEFEAMYLETPQGVQIAITPDSTLESVINEYEGIVKSTLAKNAKTTENIPQKQ